MDYLELNLDTLYESYKDVYFQDLDLDCEEGLDQDEEDNFNN